MLDCGSSDKKIELMSNNPTYLIRKSTPFGVDFLYLCKRIKQYN